ncbi:hypothetical protein CERSUDRAFT_58025, partial [Gelatoporia subvermispora B]
AMTRDKVLFPAPEEFRPERFDLTVDEATRAAGDPRQCHGPGGAHLAEASTWLALAAIISALDVTKATNASGTPIDPDVRYENMTFRFVSAVHTSKA